MPYKLAFFPIAYISLKNSLRNLYQKSGNKKFFLKRELQGVPALGVPAFSGGRWMSMLAHSAASTGAVTITVGMMAGAGAIDIGVDKRLM